MAEKANKVKFNLKEYALCTPYHWRGWHPHLRNAGPDARLRIDLTGCNGEPENFYADGGVYYVINNNCGYDGDLELALIPESSARTYLKETLDSKEDRRRNFL